MEKCSEKKFYKAFLVHFGSGVELYGTALRYALFYISEKLYRVICVLPLEKMQIRLI
jgi:hypothetical protein